MSGTTIGVVGLVILLFTGVGWIEAIRSSQRLIYGLEQQPGNFVIRWLVDVAVLVGIFLLIGASVAAIDDRRSVRFADRALTAGVGQQRQQTPLSEREITVLGLLPSLLSLDEIALDLTVSVNTVKSHLRSIYTKLGVSSRRLAVLAAHEHGLLTNDVR